MTTRYLSELSGYENVILVAILVVGIILIYLVMKSNKTIHVKIEAPVIQENNEDLNTNSQDIQDMKMYMDPVNCVKDDFGYCEMDPDKLPFGCHPYINAADLEQLIRQGFKTRPGQLIPNEYQYITNDKLADKAWEGFTELSSGLLENKIREGFTEFSTGMLENKILHNA